VYSYGLNNPSFYVDPDGRDVIAVNFSAMDNGFGHEGIITVTSDGTATYARFGPETAGSAFGKGEVRSTQLDVKVQFDTNGLPTSDSYDALTQAVARFENNQNPSSVGMNYFKTSTADTAALNTWIRQQQELSDAGKAPFYAFCTGSNCAGFVSAGMYHAGIVLPEVSTIPNMLFFQLQSLADFTHVTPIRRKTNKGHSKVCNSDGTGCHVVN
jgi:hypothetical protein